MRQSLGASYVLLVHHCFLPSRFSSTHLGCEGRITCVSSCLLRDRPWFSFLTSS